MKNKKPYTLNDLDMALMQNPDYVAEFHQAKPFSDIALQVIRIRKEAGLTQKGLAQRVGTTQQVISRIESLDTNMELNTIQRIADALNKELRIEFV